MKYGVLLLGFEYTKSKKWDSLPGIPVDLYQVYQYSTKICNNILVFTDLHKDYKTSILQNAILDGYVDSNLLSFIEDIKDKQQYRVYKSEIRNGYRMNNFDDVLSDFITGLDRLFLYYTGHAKDGDIILPDNTHVNLSYIKKIIENKMNIDSEVITILDCCESNGMNLPYKYFDKLHRLNNFDFIGIRFICMSSSQKDDNSSATRTGSLYTRYLFTYLNNNNKIISVDDIMKYIHGSNKSPTLYVSYPDIKVLWGWFTRKPYNNISVNIDNNNSIIKVKLNNCQGTVDKSSSMKNYLRYRQHGRYDPNC